MVKIIKVAVLFIVLKLLLFSLIPSFASKTIPYKGNFAYPDRIKDFKVSPELSSRANFDGIHYLLIAKEGYTQYQQAFFPLYPLLIRATSIVTNGNYLMAGVLVSRSGFMIGVVVLIYLIKKSLPRISPYKLMLMLILFPTAFFFDSVYTEGVFFLATTLVLLLLQKKRFIAAGMVAGIASGIRLVGIFLTIPLLAVSYVQLLSKKRFIAVVALFLPFVGLILYMIYLKQTTGDPLFFLNAQPAFGAQRSNHVILLPQVYFRYVKIFITARHDYQYFVAIVEFLVFNAMITLSLLELRKQWRDRNNLWFGVGLFSVANLLLPTLTGTFSSVPRYALLSISAFIYLSRINNRVALASIFSAFFVFQMILFALFCQGYFIS